MMKACAFTLLLATLVCGASASRRPAPRPQPVACPAKECFCTPAVVGGTVDCAVCACTECFPATGLIDALDKTLGCSEVRRRDAASSAAAAATRHAGLSGILHCQTASAPAAL